MSPNASAATRTQRLAVWWAWLSLRNDVRYTASLLPYSHRNINLPGQMPLSSFKLNKILDLELHSLRKKKKKERRLIWIWTRNYVPIGFRKGLSWRSKISQDWTHQEPIALTDKPMEPSSSFHLSRFRLSNLSIHQVRFRPKHVRGSS